MTPAVAALRARVLAAYNQNRDEAGKPTMTPSELGTRFGMSASTVRDVLRAAGISNERPQLMKERRRTVRMRP